MLYCALKPCLVTEKSVVNLILSNVVLSPLTVTVNPDLVPLSLSPILWPKMSVSSTKSQLNKKGIQVKLCIKIFKVEIIN